MCQNESNISHSWILYAFSSQSNVIQPNIQMNLQKSSNSEEKYAKLFRMLYLHSVQLLAKKHNFYRINFACKQKN